MSHEIIPVSAVAKLCNCSRQYMHSLARARGWRLYPMPGTNWRGQQPVGLDRATVEGWLGRRVSDEEIAAAQPRSPRRPTLHAIAQARLEGMYAATKQHHEALPKVIAAAVEKAVAERDRQWQEAISTARARAANAAVPLPDLVLPRERYPIYSEGRPDRATQIALNSMEHRHAAAWRQLLDHILSAIKPELKG